LLLLLAQAALIGFTIYVLIRLPAKKNRTRSDYPSVDKELFEKWHQTDLKADNAFLWGMAVVVVWVTFYYLVFGPPLNDTGEDIPVIVIKSSLYFIGYIIPLLPAAILQNKASRLKRKAGIS
jgi:hypothetical protein